MGWDRWMAPRGRRLAASILLLALAAAIGAAGFSWVRVHDDGGGGFSVRTFTDSTGREGDYILFVPHTPRPLAGHPVLLFLNGTGENGEDGVRQLSRNLGPAVWEIKGRFPFVCLAPQCRKNSSWDPRGPDARHALELLEAVIGELGCDRDRVILTGPSSGGKGVLSVGAARPELFAALAPLCAGSAGGDEHQATAVFAQAGMPIWSFYNDGDKEFQVDFQRRFRGRLLAAGLSPLVTEYHAKGHNCWDAAYREPALYDWLLRQRRSNNTHSPPFTLLTSANAPQLLGDDAREWAVQPDGLLQSTAGPGDRSPLALRQPLSRGDIHFDLDTEPREALVVRFASDGEAPAAALRLVIGRDEADPGLFTDDGRCLQAADPIALHNAFLRRWCDVRIELTGESLNVLTNGWRLLSCPLPAKAGLAWRVSLEPSASGAIRYLRVRGAPDPSSSRPAT